MILPPIPDEDAYRKLYKQDEVWASAMQQIARRHGLSGDPERLTLGTNVVFACGDVVIKLFAPLWSRDFDREAAGLAAVTGLPVPRILDHGTLDGWPYLLLSRVPGSPAGDIWADLPMADRLRLLGDMGALIQRLHDHEAPPALELGWDAYLAERIARAESHHDADEPWRSWIRARVTAFAPPPMAHVLLHADLTADHFLFVRDADGAWCVSGLIDFGDARLGHPFYEFPALLADYTIGEPELTWALLAAYGLDLSERDRQAITTFCLLHEFGTLQSFLGEHPMVSPDEFHVAFWGEASI